MEVMKTYQQKDLGYKRTPSAQMLTVTFSNGERWLVPVQIAADDRDENYKDDEEDTIGSIRDGGLDRFDLTDWLSNNMNWEDVAEYSQMLPKENNPFNYEADWCNAGKKFPKTV